MIKQIRHKLQILSSRSKLFLLISNDVFMAMVAWIVFGPPLINYIGTEFKNSILDTIFDQFFQFFIPTLLAIIFMWFLGFTDH